MTSAASRSRVAFLNLAAWHLASSTRPAAAFAPPSRTSRSPRRPVPVHRRRRDRRPASTMPQSRSAARDDDDDDDDSGDDRREDAAAATSRRVPNDLGLEIVRGGDDGGGEISDETWRDIEGGAPSKLMVMKDLLGINVFTYVLAAFIVFFISMNVFLGPGWLGQSLGWEDVGTFTRVSESLPLEVDVSKPEYLL